MQSVWILAKDLDIKHQEDHSKEGKRYWIRTLHLGIIVPKLVMVWGLRIIARVNATEIINHTRYTAFLVFDLQNPENLKRASAVTFGEEITEELIEEIISSTEEQNFVFLDDGKNIYGQRGRHSRRRPDGWMEIELGEVYNNLGDDSVLNICFWESDYKKRKSGLLVRGIELRPSNDP
ncbi:hypothetical protein ACJIZ3_003467 [Penstemon smallii]|uniref:Uncharacterized protein n=1 Tax=Penstemon smallii TaxID=265156 RepID=A0ABD3U9D0_9LAMI